jgi:hypothetical protein
LDTTAARERWRRRLFWLAGAGLFVFVPLQLLDYDEASFGFACVALIVSAILMFLAFTSRSLIGAAVTAAYIAAAWALLTNDIYPLREKVRWVALASQYTADVLATPAPPRRQLRHVVWDAWGWVGLDTYVYLVFDPTDSLLATSRLKSPGKPPGIACAVNSVHRLAPQWYSVRDYTSKQWDLC